MGRERDVVISRNPVVRRETLRLSRLVDVDGLGLVMPVEFEREILWLRGSGGRAVVRTDRGEGLWSSSERCDAYSGFMGAPEDLFEEAARAALRYGISPDGVLEASVVVDVADEPVLVDDEPRSFARDIPSYLRCPRDWFVAPEGFPEAWAAQPQRRRELRFDLSFLAAETILDAEIAWSSRDVDAGSRERRLADVLAKATGGLPPDEVAKVVERARDWLKIPERAAA